jgi:endo-cleaving rubber dioxygenase
MNPFFATALAGAISLLVACGGSSSGSPAAGAGDDASGNASDNTGGASEPVSTSALLGSRRGGHYWHDYCEGKPDSTPVPADPREMVTPGVNKDKAVLMNAWWQTCQDDNHPGTCGELRARSERGFALVAAEGRPGAASFFSGDNSESSFSFPAEDYAEMWDSIWGLDARPAQYDELVAQRWGMPLSVVKNPYPLPGEDPNATNGGSGQLPMGVTQLRNKDGSWTGQLNVTCSICHGGAVGSASDGEGLGPQYATNSLSDITVMFTDLARLAPQQAALAIISQNKVRGTGNITNFQLFGTLTIADYQTLPQYLTIQAEPSTGTEDPPVWWNVGSRSAKFFDGGEVTDAKRIELSFHFPDMFNDLEGAKQWILDNQQDSDAWISSLKSPPWPEQALGAIDTNLAEAGAVLFHSKDLWAAGLNNPVPRPEGGNGSCASCHGAYSPRYVNDPSYLDSPLLEGVAAYITPMEVIDTDSARLDGNSERVAQYARSNWFAYSDGPYNDQGVSLCGNWADEALRGDRELGYLAPPLYGVWATAPYFHNGSVPNIEGVLNPEARPQIWRRHSVPAPAGLEGKVVMGFDYSLSSGYDAENIGWRYDELPCEAGTSLPLFGVVTPVLDCNPVDDSMPTLQDALAVLWGNGGLAWNLLNLPILTDAQVEERKIYNTNYYSQGNGGHAFTAVLTAQERRAIIEYLKTL